MTEVANATSKRSLAGIGRVLVWPGGSVWVGRHVGRVPPHAHHAIQISLSLAGPFRVRATSWPESRMALGMVVMADQPHELDGCDGTLATLFVEPNSRPGAALRERFGGRDVSLLSESESGASASGLRDEFLSDASDERLAQFARAAICRIAGDSRTAPSSDPRITAAIRWMHQLLATTLRLDDVATRVHLSPGRFRHLFVAQTGTSFRAWLLWARAEHAIAAAHRGLSWTKAAQDAGFADAAHFTRTCRRVFGIAPTMLGFERQGCR